MHGLNESNAFAMGIWNSAEDQPTVKAVTSDRFCQVRGKSGSRDFVSAGL